MSEESQEFDNDLRETIRERINRFEDENDRYGVNELIEDIKEIVK